MSYAYTPHIWPSVVTALFFLALAAYSWRRRSVPGTLPFMVGCLFAAAIAAGSVLEYAALDAPTKIFWYKFQGVLQLLVVTALFCFILEYAWPGRWLTRRNVILLAVLPLAAFLLIATNDFHHLAWVGFQADGTVRPELGPGTWVIVIYTFLVLGAINLFVFGWLFLHSPQHRWPVTLMLTGQLGGHLVWTLAKVQVFDTILPIPLFAMAFEFFMYVIAFFGFRILDPIPIARGTVIEQLQSGMLVLDLQDRVINLNPAAERILAISTKTARGKPVEELLPAYPLKTAEVPLETEVSLGSGPESRVYRMEVSALKDWRGLEAGRLLMLRDITAEKQAQAQIIEQQRALATLQERERLARELHDSTGQVLAFVSMQTQAIVNWIRDGERDKAEAQLARLASVAQDAHNDLRSSILSLRSGDPAGWSFLTALQQYLATYQEQYGSCVELVLPPNLTEDDFPLDVGVQLVRVIQEALTNARKHAQAQNVQVFMSREGNQVTIEVSDDGVGFDLHAPPSGGQPHYGLAFMRERVGQLGGALRVESRLGEGTRIMVDVPVNGHL